MPAGGSTRTGPSVIDPSGITTDPALAMPGDSVNQWQVVELSPDGGSFRLAAAGRFPSRRSSMAYQPAVVNGAIVAVSATHLGLWPRPGPTTLSLFSSDLAEVRRLAGAAISEGEVGDPYHDARGLAAPSAASPAGVAGRSRGVRARSRRARRLRSVVRSRRRLGARAAGRSPRHARARSGAGVPSRRLHLATVAASAPGSSTFVFFCRNLFATGPARLPASPDRAALSDGLRLRFFEVLPRPAEPAATPRCWCARRWSPPTDRCAPRGCPRTRPMFEQLVDHDGRPVGDRATARRTCAG
jgi:hypothetical protein